MKKLAVFLLCFLLVLASGAPAAYADSLLENAAEAAGTQHLTDGLREDERQILGGAERDDLFDTSGALARLWPYVLERAKNELCA